MKKLITVIAFVFCGNSLFSQIYTPTTPTIYGSNNNRIKSLFVLGVPSKDTTTNTSDTSAQIFYRNVDSAFWGWSQSKGFFKVAKSGEAYSRTQTDSIAALKVNTADSGVVYVTPTKNKLSHTDSTAYHTVGQAGDSSYFTIIRPNGTRDTIRFVGENGGGGSNTASNGLTMVVNDAQLGGDLIGAQTLIGDNTNQPFILLDSSLNYKEFQAGANGFSSTEFSKSFVDCYSSGQETADGYAHATLTTTTNNQHTVSALNITSNTNGPSVYFSLVRGDTTNTYFFPTPYKTTQLISDNRSIAIPISIDGNLADSTGNIKTIDSTVSLTSGTITVGDTRVKTGARIFVSYESFSGTTGQLEAKKADIINGTSFKITSSSATDNSYVNYEIINP